MATPVIQVDAATGSDNNGGTGSTAITGSTGRTRNSSGQLRFGFFGATDDFSGVAVDGSVSLYTAISTAGQRNHGSVAAIKNTRQTGSAAAITAAAAILAVEDTTGWSVGDVVKVAGAGAAGADYYSTVLTVDSGTQATMNDNAGTTVVANAWENPKQATMTTGQGINTGTTDTAWGIGGKRATIAGTNSKKLFENNSASGDAMPGWVMEMLSGHVETVAATINTRRAGDATSGFIILRGASGAGTMPVLTFSNNGTAFDPGGLFWSYLDFEVRNSNATKTSTIVFGQTIGAQAWNVEIRNIKCAHANYFRQFVSRGGFARSWTVRDCEISTTAAGSDAITFTGSSDPNHVVENNWIYTCGGRAVVNGSNGGAVRNNGIYNCTVGVELTGGGGYILEFNTIVGCVDGVKISTTVATYTSNGFFTSIIDNILASNTGYGINLSGSGWNQVSRDMLLTIAGNNLYGNSTGTISGSITQEGGSTADPQLVSAATGNFRIGGNVRGTGWPSGNVGTRGLSRPYYDPGTQRQEQSSKASFQLGM